MDKVKQSATFYLKIRGENDIRQHGETARSYVSNGTLNMAMTHGALSAVGQDVMSIGSVAGPANHIGS